MMLNIALDYDGTYTRDPDFWKSFVQKAKESGHKVFCVTKRTPEEVICEKLVNIVDGIFYMSRANKINVSQQIDIWIDNNPFDITGYPVGGMI
ncbi:MAG: hypothetical protein KGJ01_02940 [Patescibacteria group bacterium]|nr:hypothetical protein [Patescibacteria group bacterium]